MAVGRYIRPRFIWISIAASVKQVYTYTFLSCGLQASTVKMIPVVFFLALFIATATASPGMFD